MLFYDRCTSITSQIQFLIPYIDKYFKISYNGTIFQNHSDSFLEHYPWHHGGLGNIRNQVVAIGNNSEVEIYDINNNTWAQKTTFPLCSSFWDFALVSLPDYILTIGGNCHDWTEPTNYIMRYEIDRWSQIGRLLTRRKTHNAFLNGDKIFVIGGFDWDESTKTDNSTWGT